MASPPSSPRPLSSPPLNLIIRFTASIPDLPRTLSAPRPTTPHNAFHPNPFTSPPGPSSFSPPPHPLRSSPPPNPEAKDATSLQTESQEQEDGQSTGARASLSADATTQPAPQGFDRLLSAGLSPTEVASLRSQFLAVQAHTHTPDTMPSPSEMRLLEERWLEAGTPLNATGGAGGGGVDDEAGGGLEDMLWGNVMGFFWAVGAIVWLVREEGVWSKRRQIGVVTGVLVNIAFCILRVGS
ncbi:hypothetical protein ABVK25_002744 [Lepraria finkii]|uniref:DSC E3 ubiquitin ligase complex subunit 3 C-terminal domain-containing protein n=1 Tax=Lepraria finkii TaxID=1340010 RepID=A0ABR4BGQ4_9LECA